MAIVPIVTEEQANDQVKSIYEEIKKTFKIPFVPNLFKAMGNNPDYLEATWTLYKSAMVTADELTPREKELVAMAVSATNNCEYCILAHSAALKGLGLSDKGMVELMGVIGLYNNMNKFLDGLMIEPDMGVN